MQANLAREIQRGFLGVNLRRDTASLADQEVIKAINADLHSRVGTVLLRKGRTLLATVGSSPVRRIAKHRGTRLAVAGTTLYVGTTSLITGLHSELVTTLTPFQPLNDTTIWTFVADRSDMQKTDGTLVLDWGIAAPTATPGFAAGGAGSLTGNYKVVFTYVRKVGSAIAHESNPSPSSATVALSAQVGSITGMTASADAQVTHKRIYRTVAGGSTFLFDQEITNATTTATTSQADSALGAAVEQDNDQPPIAAWVQEFQGSLFLCRNPTVPNGLYWSKRFRPESFPTANFILVGDGDDPLQCAVSMAGMLGVFTKNTKYRIVGTTTTGFVAQEALTRRGTSAFNAVLPTEYGIVYPNQAGVFVTNLTAPDTPIGQNIEPIFNGDARHGLGAVNWDVASLFFSASYRNRYYLALALGADTTPGHLAVYSHDTRNWYFYTMPVQAMLFEEDIQGLVGGSSSSGAIWQLEDGTSDVGGNISFDVETRDFQSPAVYHRRRFYYINLDADSQGDNITLEFIVDDASKFTKTFVAGRLTAPIPLPAGIFGRRWRARVTYAGTKQISINGVDVYSLDLSPTP